jgi:hypothetical protein
MTGRLLLAVGLVLTTALAVAWGSGGRAQATTFNPFFGPPDFYRLDSTSPGAYSDIQARFNILPPSANFSPHFGGLVTFGDSDVFVADSAGIPGTGAYVGRLQSTAQLGLANEGCSNQIPVTFELVEANTDTTALSIDTPPGDGNPATSDDPLLLNAAITPVATSLVYTGASGTDPMGRRTDGLPINIIQVDLEQMLVTNTPPLPNSHGGMGGGSNAAKTYTVTRGWNGTVPAAHLAGAEIKRVNIIFPAGPDSNLLANLAEDDGNMDNQGGVENADLVNGVADGADAVPSYVRDSLDPDVNAANGGYVQARARYEGVAFVANTLLTILQFVVMDAGALTAFPNLDWATAAWGYSSVTFLQDPLAPPSNSAISDFCNFTSDTFLLGTPHDNACTATLSPPGTCTGTGAGFTLRLAADGGCPGSTMPNECGTSCGPNCASPCDPATCYRQKNSATAQSVRFYQYAVSQRDYDNDGIENGLDACPANPNASWNPRTSNSLSGNDSDADGLPDACDPAPTTPNTDQDGDGWPNRLDNCPTVANSSPGGGGGTVPNTFQYDRDVPPGQDVPDGGPPSDDIPPACDTGGGGTGTLTPNGANGHYHAKYAAQTICIGPATMDCDDAPTADADGDGVVNARDACIGGYNPPTPFQGPSGQDITTVAAHAGDSTIVVGSTGGFVEQQPIVIGLPGDGKGGRETLRYITAIAGGAISFTPPLSQDHIVTTNVAMVAFAQSILDVNGDGYIDMIGDISYMNGRAWSQGGDPANDGVGDNAPPGYEARIDLNDDRFIDVTGDIALVGGQFGRRCGPPYSPI